jgi:hypothetical protein
VHVGDEKCLARTRRNGGPCLAFGVRSEISVVDDRVTPRVDAHEVRRQVRADGDTFAGRDVDARGRLAEPLGRGSSDAEVVTFLAALRSLGEGVVAEPSLEVVTSLGGARARGAGAWYVSSRAVAAAADIAAAVVAAANHDLPSPAQRVVSERREHTDAVPPRPSDTRGPVARASAASTQRGAAA